MNLRQLNQPMGASPRHLDVRELHLELRRAQKTIEIAAAMMPLDQASKLHKALVVNKIVEDEDWLGCNARHIALNRTTPCRDHFKIFLIALCILLSVACYSVQQDYGLLIEQLGGHHGSIN